jgi:hypothetical protein
MMKSRWGLALLAALAAFPPAAWSEAVNNLLKQYQAQGAANFSAATAAALWTKPFLDAKTGESRRCATCHSEDLRRSGKHAVTGKLIEPLAPSANAQRLTDVEKIEKWLGRNCKWVMGRECSPQEKGDFLEMIRSK